MKTSTPSQAVQLLSASAAAGGYCQVNPGRRFDSSLDESSIQHEPRESGWIDGKLVADGAPSTGGQISLITPTPHEKSEWSRFAKACYAAGLTRSGHRFSALAAMRSGQRLPLPVFDTVQHTYRSWLVFGEMPAA